jgi:hypothetical protein
MPHGYFSDLIRSLYFFHCFISFNYIKYIGHLHPPLTFPRPLTSYALVYSSSLSFELFFFLFFFFGGTGVWTQDLLPLSTSLSLSFEVQSSICLEPFPVNSALAFLCASPFVVGEAEFALSDHLHYAHSDGLSRDFLSNGLPNGLIQKWGWRGDLPQPVSKELHTTSDPFRPNWPNLNQLIWFERVFQDMDIPLLLQMEEW